MHPKSRKIRRQLERAGGLVYMPDDVPDEIAELFLEEVMQCPECAAAVARGDLGSEESSLPPSGPRNRGH